MPPVKPTNPFPPMPGFLPPMPSNATAHSTPALPNHMPTPIAPTSLGVQARTPAPVTPPPNTLPSSQVASVNSSWPGSVSPVPAPTSGATNTGLYGELINRLSNYGPTKEQKSAYALASNLETGLAAGNNAIMNKPIALPFQQGQMAALQRDYGPQLQAANRQLELANQGAQQGLQGITSAAGLAAPTALPFTAQLTDPITGKPISGGSPIIDSISSYAQQVNSGRMAIGDAQAALGNNPYFNALLQQAVQGNNPNFNTSASNTIAGPQYQTLLNSFQTTSHHLGDLLSSVKNLPLTSYPLINQGLNGIYGAIGSKAFQDYQTKLGVARAEVANILGGGQATDQSRHEAEGVLPSNLGPDQLEAAINAATQLMQEKIQSYGSLGGVNNIAQQALNPGQAPTNSVGWF